MLELVSDDSDEDGDDRGGRCKATALSIFCLFVEWQSNKQDVDDSYLFLVCQCHLYTFTFLCCKRGQNRKLEREQRSMRVVPSNKPEFVKKWGGYM